MKRLYTRDDGAEASFTYDGASLAQTLITMGREEASFTLAPAGTPLAQARGETLTNLGLDPHSDISFAQDTSGDLQGVRLYDPYGGGFCCFPTWCYI